MGLETVTDINDLDISNPLGTDPRSQGDDHIRNIKKALKTDFPSITGAMTATQAELNVLDGVTAGTVTASKGVVVDATSKVDVWNVDNLTIDGNTLTANTGAINITPAAGSAIVLDATINVDAGVVTGATSITSTTFSGDLTGAVTGNADTATSATTAGTVTTAAQTAITSLGTLTALQTDNINIDGNTLTASTGAINITPAAGSAIVLDATMNVDAGVVTGATSITSTAFVGTLSTAAQANVTSLGTLTALQTDNININGNTIISTDTAGNINVTPNTTGDLILDGVKWPQADGTANQILTTDGAAQTSWATPVTTTALTTQGDILFRNASALARLGAGTNGQFLTSGGAGADVSWSTAADLSSVQTNIALLGFLRSTDHATSVLNMQNGFIDQFEDQTGVDDVNSVVAGYDASNDLYHATPKTAFSYTGSNQTYVVPAGVASLVFKAWGAGGGGGNAYAGGGVGGGGGYVEEVLFVTPGETLNIKVGGGGVYEGAGGSQKGGGGGWTSIDRSGTYLAGAGGGGGGVSLNVSGGAGGGTTGGSPTGGTGVQATGGTQVGGGTAGTGGGAGSSLTGGTCTADVSNDAAGGYNGGGGGDGDNTTYTSAGGGGGYYGGGSGGNQNLNQGAGGGGSSYAPTGTNTQASGQTVANAGDTDYSASTGNGGAANANGQNGYSSIQVPYNMTLISEPQTALTAPDSAHVALFNEELATLTINTDILAWVSRSKQTFTATNATNVLNASAHGLVDTDRVMVISSAADLPLGLDSETVYYIVTAAAGTFQVSLTSGGAAVTFSDDGTGTHSVLAVSQCTLVDQGDFGTGKATLSGTVDISGQPSDTDMTLVVQTKNNKDTKLHGQALQYS